MIRPSTLIRHSPDQTPGRDSWQDSAACIDVAPELFFIPGQGSAWEQPNHAEQRDEAKAVCGRCPVAAECLAAADNVDPHLVDRDSIRGGLTPFERDRVKRAAKRKSRAKEQRA